MVDVAPKYEIYEDGRLHDLMYTDTGDFRFWVEEAQKCVGDTVLELACGTGNVGIALVQAGYVATGMDLSSKMLEVAWQKGERKGVQVNWIEGDMRSFNLGTRFSLVILGGNSLCHLRWLSVLRPASLGARG